MRCAACGYGRGHHDAVGRCPLCACGIMPGEHRPVVLVHRPVVTLGPSAIASRKFERRCPGKLKSDTGRYPQLRRGSFRPAVAEGRTRDWFGMRMPIIEAPVVADVVPAAPLVPARYTTGLDEIAPAAMRLGRKVAAEGWAVDPWYWQAADGTETSALVMQRDELRAFASWERSPGASWRVETSLGWRHGDLPRKVGVTALAAFMIG